MLLSIITLNYKKPELTMTCVRSLYKQFAKEFEAGVMELVIVDNGSGDDSVENIQTALKKHAYQRVFLLEQKENGGFGKGCNAGATVAKGDFLLFLNNDTEVHDKGILAMAQYLQTHEDVAILGGQLRNADGSLQPSIGKFYTLGNVFLLLLGFQKFGLLDRGPTIIREVDWVKGGLLMIRKDIFNKLKGFDENIFMYTEDMELCYRARKAGYKSFFYPNVTIVHAEHGSASRSFAIVQIYQGLLYFYKKHRTGLEYQIVKGMLIIKAWVAIGMGTLTGKQELVKTYKEAKLQIQNDK